MTLVEFILSFVATYPILTSFLAGLLTGEEVVMTLAFFSATGLLPFWIVFVFATLGMYLCDTFFFALGKSSLAKRIILLKKIESGYKKVDEVVGKLTKEKHLLILLYTKFIYGARIASLLFLGIKQVSWKKFLTVNLAIALLWGIVVIPLGWLAGKGFKIILDIFQNIQLALTFIFIILVMLIITKRWINKKLMKKPDQLI